MVATLLTDAASAQTKTVVKLGVSGRPDQAHLELALRRGYFEQEGLDVQTVQASTGMEMLPALAQNQLQAASGSPNGALYNALNRGIEIRIVADFAHVGDAKDRTISLVVRKDLVESGAIKTLADLKGKSLSPGPGPAQISEIFFSKVLAKANLTLADINQRYMTFSDALSAMASKSIDGSFMVEPLITAAEKQNIGAVLATGGSAIEGAHLSVVYYSPEFAKQREPAVRFMVAYLKGVRDFYDAFFLNKGKAETIALLVQHLPMKDPAMWEPTRQFIDLNGKMNVADLKAQGEYYRKSGAVTGTMADVTKFIDTSFAEEAVKRLGERKRE
jgi:NitT/TauT family transport system substrate-binding protein